MLLLFNLEIRLFALCPPTHATKPKGSSFSQISNTLSIVNSSKYSRSGISKSVETVSGLQLITQMFFIPFFLNPYTIFTVPNRIRHYCLFYTVPLLKQ